MASLAALPHCAARSSVSSTIAITNVTNTPTLSSVAPTSLAPRLPRMKSLGEIQSALYKVMIAILDFRVSPRRAGARLFDLQQASLAFRKPHRKRN